MKLIEYVARDGAMLKGNVGPAVSMAQADLNHDGADLVIDGKFGNATDIAVRAFQARHYLAVDGIVGENTAAALDVEAVIALSPARPSPTVKSGAPWLTAMRAITGEQELPGAADSPFVLGMAKFIGEKYPELSTYARLYTHDSVPWCGLTVAYVMAQAGIAPVSTEGDLGFLWADRWKVFGQHVEPRVGAVGVFTRNGAGHVSLIERVTADGFYIRGGNQSDMVNVIFFSKDKLTDTRWPTGWPVVDVPGMATTVAIAGSTR